VYTDPSLFGEASAPATPSAAPATVEELEALYEEAEVLSNRRAETVDQFLDVMRPILRKWFRADVRGIENVPTDGGALLVSNHSGGMFPTDIPILMNAMHERFGHERPLYVLAFDFLFKLPVREWIGQIGAIRANRRNAHVTLRSGNVALVFPGGDRDASRPSWKSATVDFGGRTGYIRTALESNVPIVPAVVLGGQETQFFIPGGAQVARLLGLKKRLNATSFPVTLGFPFGLSFANLPMPVKHFARILEPIDLRTHFGDDVDIEAADRLVRARMQEAMDALQAERVRYGWQR